MALVAESHAAARPASPASRPGTVVSVMVSVLAVATSSFAIASTYGRVSQTWDEPTHIAAGLEWVQKGTYRLQTENPPLGRVAAGLGAYAAGGRLTARQGVNAQAAGRAVLYHNGELQERILHGARAGVLPFFWLTALCVWLWLGRVDPVGAAVAVACLSTIPPVLAHSGLATTDMPFVGVFMVALLTFRRWVQDPTWWHTLVLAVALSTAVLTKFTSIPFFAAACVGFGMVHRTHSPTARWPLMRRTLGHLSVTAIVFAVIAWGLFRFDVGALDQYSSRGGPPMTPWTIQGPGAPGIMGYLSRAFSGQDIPAPAFWHGLMTLSAHNHAGHEAYALGRVSLSGFWYAYPLALLVKTPVPFLVLVVFAAIVVARYRRSLDSSVIAAGFTAVLALVAMLPSRVNIGVRHVLLLYPLLAVVVGHTSSFALRQMDARRRRSASCLIAVLLVWQVVTTVRGYPDWLGFFNGMAGSDPGWVLNDSDLDWGQGLRELARFSAEHRVEKLTLLYNGSALPCAYGLPALSPLHPTETPKGWVAISERHFRPAVSRLRRRQPVVVPLRKDYCDPNERAQLGSLDPDAHAWLDSAEPVAFAGRSIRLYYLK